MLLGEPNLRITQKTRPKCYFTFYMHFPKFSFVTKWNEFFQNFENFHDDYAQATPEHIHWLLKSVFDESSFIYDSEKSNPIVIRCGIAEIFIFFSMRLEVEAAIFFGRKKNVRLYFSLNQKSLLYKLFLLSFCTTCIEGIFDLGQNKDVHLFLWSKFCPILLCSEQLFPYIFSKMKRFCNFSWNFKYLMVFESRKTPIK